MYGGITFREATDHNKTKILSYLKDKDFTYTHNIFSEYGGEKDIYQVRKALKELEREGLVVWKKSGGMNCKMWKLKTDNTL